jgi:hypothetical protein
MTAAEIKCMRRTTGHTWTYYKSNSETTKELNITLPQFWTDIR